MRANKNMIKGAVLSFILATGLLIGSTDQARAAWYPDYLTSYSDYYSDYSSTGRVSYYYFASAFLYYYYAGYNGDYYGYNSDAFGAKSTPYKGSTNLWDAYYDYYAYIGDENASYGYYYYNRGE
jgi:hypothetical protein